MTLIRRPLSAIDFVALDLETTGLSPVACRIVEIGAARFRLAQGEVDCIEQLVDPGCPIPLDVQAIHGIDDLMVRGQPTVAEALPRLVEFVGGPETVLLAHHAEFDLSFLALALARAGLPPPPNAVIDTLSLSRRCIRGARSHGLESLARRLGLAHSEEHRALADARLAMRLFQAIVTGRPGLNCLGDLFNLSRPLTMSCHGGLLQKPPAGYEQLGAAIVRQQTVLIVYAGGTGGSFQRRVTPRALLESRGRCYLSALCHSDRMEKTYRLDRILEFELEEES